mmetsp:Transcript_102620/g.201259  ORF Transcript_102620/g.201259 Transcript_102620/m.201259 type:complete len:260 (-) Transcript_102620:111-890(-)
MAVMSSTASLHELFDQRSRERAHKASNEEADGPSRNRWPAAPELLQNSNRPSVPSNSSTSTPGRNRYAETSGSAITPQPTAAEAPSERVSASAGRSCPRAKTRTAPDVSRNRRISPPLSLMRSASSTSSGRWSLVNAVTVKAAAGSPPPRCDARIALESPTWAMNNHASPTVDATGTESILPSPSAAPSSRGALEEAGGNDSTSASVAVVPLCAVSKGWSRRLDWVCRKASRKVSSGLRSNVRWPNKLSGRAPRAKAAQ